MADFKVIPDVVTVTVDAWKAMERRVLEAERGSLRDGPIEDDPWVEVDALPAGQYRWRVTFGPGGLAIKWEVHRDDLPQPAPDAEFIDAIRAATTREEASEVLAKVRGEVAGWRWTAPRRNSTLTDEQRRLRAVYLRGKR